MKLIAIESPYAGDVERNLRYLRACMADCLSRGEAPYASHALYTQPGVLDDDIAEERQLGIDAGFAWAERADVRVVYTDLGISTGMAWGVRHANTISQSIEYRTIGAEWSDNTKSNTK